MNAGKRDMKDTERIKTGFRSCLYGAAALLICSATGLADTLTLTGVQGGVMGGVYTSPYVAQINGSAAFVICDDFTTQAFLDVPFTANPTSVASLTGTSPVKFDKGSGNQQQDYARAAYLAREIIQENSKATPDVAQLGYYSFALWSIFDPALLQAPNGTTSCSPGYVGCLTAAQLAAVNAKLTDAINNAGSYLQYSDVIVYTPSPLNASQEFLSVGPVPEPSAISLLAAGLLGLMGTTLRRKRVGAPVSRN